MALAPTHPDLMNATAPWASSLKTITVLTSMNVTLKMADVTTCVSTHQVTVTTTNRMQFW